MKICLVSTHSFPIPLTGTETHTGDVVIADLAYSLNKLGHTVYFAAPKGSYIPSLGKLLPMRASYGNYPPSSMECEYECFINYKEEFKSCDIVHDFSNTRMITNSLNKEGYFKTLCTIMGGCWNQPNNNENIIAWSEAHKDRILRGATDYECTPTPDLAGPPGTPMQNVSVVNGGIDTDYYTPTYIKEDFYLWLNRWHEVKGYKQAIELAKKTGIQLILAGEHPDNERYEYQRNCALEAYELSKGYDNIKVVWLPGDPNHHTAKLDLYRKAKALLYTVQFQEPFGLSQTEALSCGTPVIGTNYGSVNEVIKDGITGFVRDNNIESFESALKLIETIDIKRCREEAVNRFDRIVMAENYIKQYRKVIGI